MILSFLRIAIAKLYYTNMLDPYKMVLVNSILSAVLIAGIFLYRYVYPKKKINLLFLLILFSLLVCVSIFRKGIYESGDFTIHMYRSIAFYQSLADGQFLPSWAAGLNATYGYALFIFNYTLPYYFVSLFHFLGFSFIASLKLFLASNFILSGIFMYICAKKLFRNDTAAFVTAVFYQFAPYHLIDLHFKIVIGEIMVFTLLPLVFYSLQKLWEKKSILWLCIASISIALLIMSHVVLALFGLLLFFCYALYQWIQSGKKFYFLSTILVFILGTLSSIYIWLAPFFMTQYTLFRTAEDFVYFPQFWELLFSPWAMGLLYQGHNGELSFLLGYTHIFVGIALAILLFRNKINSKYKRNSIFWIAALIVLIFLITPLSKFLWGIIPFLKVTGSHRLLVLTSFVSAITAGYFSLYILRRQKMLVILIGITIFSTILNWGHRTMIMGIDDQHYIDNLWKSTSEIEGHFYANSKWRSMKDPWFDSLPKAYLETEKNSAEIRPVTRTTTYHTYVVSAQRNVEMRENTLYFPGWQGFDNGKPLQLQPDSNGLITFPMSKGLHFIEIKYDDIFIYKALKIISVTVFIILVGFVLLSIMKKTATQVKHLFKRFFSNN